MNEVQNFLNTTQKSISFFTKLAMEGHLQMKPPFQRNPVWTDSQKSYLIDTILRGFPVPELYMQIDTTEDGDETFIVVDGQQRLRACIDFVQSKYSLQFGEERNPRSGFTFSDLSGEERKRLFSYQFVIRLLPDVQEELLRDIFQRLNRNVVSLNAQELRHATYWGPFIQMVEKIAEKEFWSASGIVTPNDVRRMLDVEFVSELAIAYIHGLQNKKQSLAKWYALYEQSFDIREDVEEGFDLILKEIEAMLPNIRSTRWRKKSDFYSLFFFLAKKRRNLPLAAEERVRISGKLVEFGTSVDEFIAGGPEPDAAEPIVLYTRYVERAASDLGSRKNRDSALRAWVDNVPLSEAESVSEEDDRGEDEQNPTESEIQELEKMLSEG